MHRKRRFYKGKKPGTEIIINCLAHLLWGIFPEAKGERQNSQKYIFYRDPPGLYSDTLSTDVACVEMEKGENE